MRRTASVLALVAIIVGALALPALARGEGNPHPEAVVYVTSQDLYYESIVLTDLPFTEGAPFQKLEMVNGGLQTEFGPGDPGYLGGRWWVDVNGNNTMDEGDSFFLCPLLGNGHESPPS